MTHRQKLMSRINHFGQDYYAHIRMFNRNIRLFLLGELIVGFGLNFWFLLFNLYLQESHYSKEFIGQAAAISNFAVALLSLPAGYIAVRYNQKVWLIISQWLSSAAYAGAIFAAREGDILGLVFMAAALSSYLLVVTGPFIMANSSPVERTYIFSVDFIIMLGGGIFGNALGGVAKDFITATHGIMPLMAYRYAILAGLSVTLLGTIPYFFIRLPATGQTGATDKRIKLSELNWPLFGKAAVPLMLISLGAGLIVPFINIYFKDTFQSPDHAIGFYMSLQVVTMILGVLLAPALAEKIGKVKVIVFSQLAVIIPLIVMALTNDLSVALTAALFRSALMSMSTPVVYTLMMELSRPGEQGIMSAIFNIAWSACWAVAALVFGIVLNGNYTDTFYIAAILYGIASMTFYFFFRRVERLSRATQPNGDFSAN